MFGNSNEFEMNSNITGNNNVIENEMNIDIDMNNNQQPEINGGMAAPITEAVQERCIHRTIVHEVPQEWVFLIDQR